MQFRSVLFAAAEQWASEYGLRPTVDAFCRSKSDCLVTHSGVKRFWTRNQDAFQQSWLDEHLWLHPPNRLWEDCVTKIMGDQARGLALVPTMKHERWWWVLGEFAVDWVDFSDPSQIFEPSSVTRDLKIPYRLIFFDAMGADRERGGSPSPNQFADPQRGGSQTDDWEPVRKIFRKRRPVNKSTGTVPSPTAPSCPPSALPISGADFLLLPSSQDQKRAKARQKISQKRRQRRGQSGMHTSDIVSPSPQTDTDCSVSECCGSTTECGMTSESESEPEYCKYGYKNDFDSRSAPTACGHQETGVQVQNLCYPRSVQSVIQTDLEHPDCQMYREQLLSSFKDTLFTPRGYEEDANEHRGPSAILRLDLVDNPQPMSFKAIRSVGVREVALREKIDSFLKKGFIQKSEEDSPEWVSRAFLVPKPNGKWRLVIDYRHLNTQLKGQNFPLPVIEDQLANQNGNFLWSLVDLEDGFHQMHLAREHWHYTSFITPFGVYEWKVLPMGVKVGPQAFQRMVAYCLKDCPDSRPYIDDVLTGTGKKYACQGQVTDHRHIQHIMKDPDKRQEYLQDHYAALHHLFTNLAKAKLYVKPEKCHLFQLQVQYCGHILREGRGCPSPAKTEAIRNWDHNTIKTPKALKGFLGLANWYSIYIPKYVTHAAPLMDALKGKYLYEQQTGPSITKDGMPAKKRKRVKLSAAEARIHWTEPMIRGFNAIKEGLRSAVDLYLPTPNGKWKITTDACDYAVGGVLEQQGTDGGWHPVAFFSRKLQGSSGKQDYDYPEKNSPEFEKTALSGRGQMQWTVREKETYALVCALLKFQAWIGGQEVTVRTDHSSILQWYKEDLCTISGLLGRRGRWHEFLSRFNLHIEYLPGEQNEVGDTLSRWAYPAGDFQDTTFHGSTLDAEGWDRDEQGEQARTRDFWQREYPGEFLDPAALASVSAQFSPLAPECFVSSLADVDSIQLHTEFEQLVSRSLSHVCSASSPPPLEYVSALNDLSWHMPGAAQYAVSGLESVKVPPAISILQQDWSEFYKTDPEFQDIWPQLVKDRAVGKYFFSNGKVRSKGRICVPVAIVKQLLNGLHSYSHPGTDKLRQLFARKFSARMKRAEFLKAVSQVAKQCNVCQATKPRRGAQPDTLEFFPIPQFPFSSISIDFVSVPELKVGHQLYNNIMAVVCRLTGYILAVPCSNTLSSEALASLFLERVVSFMGLPHENFSGHDSILKASFFDTLMKLSGVEDHKSTVYNPKANGRAERAVQSIIQSLRQIMEQKISKDWFHLLPLATWALNDLPGAVPGYSPHRLVFGRDPMGFGDCPPIIPEDGSEDAASFFNRLISERRQVQKKLCQINKRQTQKFLQKHPLQVFSPGDRVWVRIHKDLKNNSNTAKLDRIWTGPAEVLERVGTGRYRVYTHKGEQILESVRLKPYQAPISGNQPPLHFYTDAEEMVESDRYIVEEILDHKPKGRGKNRGTKWFVKYQGYEEPEWQDARAFLHDINEDWMAYNKRHKLLDRLLLDQVNGLRSAEISRLVAFAFSP